MTEEADILDYSTHPGINVAIALGQDSEPTSSSGRSLKKRKRNYAKTLPEVEKHWSEYRSLRRKYPESLLGASLRDLAHIHQSLSQALIEAVKFTGTDSYDFFKKQVDPILEALFSIDTVMESARIKEVKLLHTKAQQRKVTEKIGTSVSRIHETARTKRLQAQSASAAAVTAFANFHFEGAVVDDGSSDEAGALGELSFFSGVVEGPASDC